MSPRLATVFSFVSTIALYMLFWAIGEFGSPALSAAYDESLLKLVVWVLPSLVLVMMCWRLTPAGALREIGLLANPLTGYAVGLLTTIPLAALWLLLVRFPTLSASAVVGTSIVGPFAEEVLFRGLLFRQLVRRGARRPVWSMAMSAIVFGAAHLTGFVDFLEGHLRFAYEPGAYVYMTEFGVTALGGLLFAWMVLRWDSLWPAIGVHSALNLSWQLTHDAGDVTSYTTTMMRLASFTIAIYVTWRGTRGKRGQLRTWKPELGTSEDHA